MLYIVYNRDTMGSKLNKGRAALRKYGRKRERHIECRRYKRRWKIEEG